MPSSRFSFFISSFHYYSFSLPVAGYYYRVSANWMESESEPAAASRSMGYSYNTKMHNPPLSWFDYNSFSYEFSSFSKITEKKLVSTGSSVARYCYCSFYCHVWTAEYEMRSFNFHFQCANVELNKLWRKFSYKNVYDSILRRFCDHLHFHLHLLSDIIYEHEMTYNH